MNVSSSQPTSYFPHPPCFCAVNNHGASLVKAGYYKQAIEVLTVGLKQVRDQMATNKNATVAGAPTMPCSSTSSTPSCCAICFAGYHDGNSFIMMSAPHQTAGDNDNNNNNNNKSPLSLAQRLSTEECMTRTTMDNDTNMSIDTHKVPQDDQNGDEDQEQNHFLFRVPMYVPNIRQISLGTISFMMIFNMALSYDLTSESLGDEDHENILMGDRAKATALKLYQLAYKVQDGEGSSSEVPLLYLCGLLNNMARLYRYTTNNNDREMATWCLAYLLSILMYYTTEKQKLAFTDARGNPHLESYFLTKFFHSTSAIILKDPATAGAA